MKGDFSVSKKPVAIPQQGGSITAWWRNWGGLWCWFVTFRPLWSVFFFSPSILIHIKSRLPQYLTLGHLEPRCFFHHSFMENKVNWGEFFDVACAEVRGVFPMNSSCNPKAISKGRYDSLKTLVARCFATLDLKSHYWDVWGDWEHWEYWKPGMIFPTPSAGIWSWVPARDFQ